MNIKIFQKIIPFSKKAGTSVIIPKTTYEVKIFPIKLSFIDKRDEDLKRIDIFLDIEGPIDNFLIFQNLEKKYIEVQGKSKKGFFRYNILATEDKIALIFKKITNGKIFINKNEIIVNKPIFLISKIEKGEKENLERLFLGINKSQDMDLIIKRRDLREIFPIWYMIGRDIIDIPSRYEGVAILLKDIKDNIVKNKKEEIETLFLNLFKAGFYDLFTPRLFDDQYQAIVSKDLKISKDSSSLVILKEGKELIRELFFKEEKRKINMLPLLLPSFSFGRFINIESSYGRFDIQWSKKLLKKMIFYSSFSGEIEFQLQKKIKTFRLKEKNKILKKPFKLEVEKNKIYLFDRFQK